MPKKKNLKTKTTECEEGRIFTRLQSEQRIKSPFIFTIYVFFPDKNVTFNGVLFCIDMLNVWGEYELKVPSFFSLLKSLNAISLGSIQIRVAKAPNFTDKVPSFFGSCADFLSLIFWKYAFVFSGRGSEEMHKASIKALNFYSKLTSYTQLLPQVHLFGYKEEQKVSSIKRIRLLESIEKVSKPMQHSPCRRDQESEGQSSSNLPLESEQPMLHKFTAPLLSLQDSPPNQDQEAEGHSGSRLPSECDAVLINHTAPLPSRPLKDAVNAMYDNVLTNGNEDIREADSSPAAANVVGAQPVQQTRPNANPTFSYGLTEMANMLADEGSSEDEVESSGLITIIGKYSVKEALAPTVRRIIEKHGDIAANYVMQTPEFRSLALEQLAKFIQKYDAEKFAELCEKKIERALEIVSDFGRGGFNVIWLEQRLKDLLEARKTVKQRSQLKEKKDKLDQVIKEKNAFLITAKKELREALAEAERIKETVAKVKDFFDHPPFFGLL